MLSLVARMTKAVGESRLKILIICLIALAVVGTVYFSWEREKEENPGPEAGALEVDNQMDSVPENGAASVEVDPGAVVEVKPQEKPVPPQETEKANEVEKTESGPMIWPGQGRLITRCGFAYSETFDDRRYHKGIDISLPPGYEVKAALPGTVSQLSSSALWGNEITITHPGKLETRYMGLKPKNLKAGAPVTKGQVIGTVTQPPKYEAKMNPHLHFEVYLDGKVVDPLEYLN